MLRSAQEATRGGLRAEQLLQELATAYEKLRLIGRVLWRLPVEQMSRSYDTVRRSRIRDFVLELFKSCYAMGTDGE
jgi:hypothetical protein